MKKFYIFGGIFIVILIIASVIIFRAPKIPTVEGLTTQLNGGTCSFETIIDENPIGRSLYLNFISKLTGLHRRDDGERCVIDAAKLLPAAGTNENKDVVPILIEALKTNSNIDTGDGIIRVRSEIALALGRIGDKRALQPLQDILNSEDLAVLANNGSFPIGYAAEKKSSQKAVMEAMKMINDGR